MAALHVGGIAGREHGHARQDAHEREVLDRVVRGPEVAVGQPAADAHELHVGLGHRDVDADLVVRARGDERRDRVGEGHLPGVGEAGGEADEVLLGDADVEVAPRARPAANSSKRPMPRSPVSAQMRSSSRARSVSACEEGVPHAAARSSFAQDARAVLLAQRAVVPHQLVLHEGDAVALDRARHTAHGPSTGSRRAPASASWSWPATTSCASRRPRAWAERLEIEHVGGRAEALQAVGVDDQRQVGQAAGDRRGRSPPRPSPR